MERLESRRLYEELPPAPGISRPMAAAEPLASAVQAVAAAAAAEMALTIYPVTKTKEEEEEEEEPVAVARPAAAAELAAAHRWESMPTAAT